jgi:hypothetical protein
LREGYAARLCRHVPWEGGWDTGVGRSSSILQNSRILIVNPPSGFTDCKNLTKKEIDEHTSMEKYKNENSLVAFGKVKNLTNLPTTLKARARLEK